MAIDVKFTGDATEFSNAATTVLASITKIATQSQTAKDNLKEVFQANAGAVDAQLKSAAREIAALNMAVEKLTKQQGSLASAMTTDTRAAEDNSRSINALRKEHTELANQVGGTSTARFKQLTAILAQHRVGLENSRMAVKAHIKESKEMNAVLDKSQYSASLAGANMISFGQTLSDLPYGIRGVANNLQQLTATIILQRQATGSWIGVFSELKKAFLGPLGVIVLVQGAIAALDFFSNKAAMAASKQKQLAEETHLTSVAVQEEKAELLAMQEILNNHLGTREKQEAALQRVQDITGELTELTLDEAGAMEKINAAIGEYIILAQKKYELDFRLKRLAEAQVKITDLRGALPTDPDAIKLTVTDQGLTGTSLEDAKKREERAKILTEILPLEKQVAIDSLEVLKLELEILKLRKPKDGDSGKTAKEIEEEIHDHRQLIEALLNIDKENTKARIETAQERIEFERQLAQDELNDIRLDAIHKGHLTEEVELAINLRKAQIDEEAAAKQRIQSFKDGIDRIELEQQFANLSLNNHKKNGESQKEFEDRLAKEKLRITEKFLIDKLDLLLIDEDLNADQIAKLKQLLKDVRQQLDKETPKDEEGWLNKVLGLSDKEIKANAKALRRMVDAVADAMNDLNDLQQAQLDKKMKMLAKDRSDTEDNIKTQRALNDEGLANDLNAELEHLARIEEQQKQSFERHKELEKQKQNIATITQATNLVTGASTILATEAINPILAAATIAAMFAAFIAAHVKSRQLINQEQPEFYEGGFTERGNKYDEAGIVHKGEFVANQELTAKHRDLLEAMHNSDPIPYSSLVRLLDDTGVTGFINPTLPIRELRMGQAKLHQNSVQVQDPELLAELKRNTAATERLLKKNETIDMGDRIIQRNGSITRVIKK